MLGLLPRTALVENIGFGGQETHTTSASDKDQTRVEPISFPLKHPSAIVANLAAEESASLRYFSRRSTLERIGNKFVGYIIKKKFMAKNYKGKHAYTGSVATCYDKDRVVEPLWALEQDYLKKWTATLPIGTVLIDVPVGTGRFLEFYRQHQLHVYGIDVSADMIAQARLKLGESGDWCNLSVGDAEKLLLPDRAVDCVVCWRLAHLLPASILLRILQEFCRVARKEIVIEILSIENESSWPAFRKMKLWLRPLWGWTKGRRSDVPWSHITNYSYTVAEVTTLFQLAKLTVRSTSVINLGQGQSAFIFHLNHA